jgi:hypothetical protein
MSRERTRHYVHSESFRYDEFRQGLAILCPESSAPAPMDSMSKLVNHRTRRISSFYRKGDIVFAVAHAGGKGVAFEAPNENGKADSHCIAAL